MHRQDLHRLAAEPASRLVDGQHHPSVAVQPVTERRHRRIRTDAWDSAQRRRWAAHADDARQSPARPAATSQRRSVVISLDALSSRINQGSGLERMAVFNSNGKASTLCMPLPGGTENTRAARCCGSRDRDRTTAHFFRPRARSALHVIMQHTISFSTKSATAKHQGLSAADVKVGAVAMVREHAVEHGERALGCLAFSERETPVSHMS
jgi:hypothetical protein